MTHKGAAGSGAAGRGAADSSQVGTDAPGKGSVLVTRPAGQACALCDALRGAGYAAYSQPLLELQAVPQLSPPQRQLLLGLDSYQHIIFISGNAVSFGMPCIENYWPQLPVAVNWYAIGQATADSLKKFGIQAITPGAVMTSEGLLAVASLQKVADQRILIVKGEGGRGTLRQELQQRGARVDELACYRRCCPDLARGNLAAKLSRWHIDTLMISSGEGLANLQTLLSAVERTKFSGISLIVPSERVARMAREAGFEQVVTARNASDVAMLQALQERNPSSGE